MLSEIDLGTLVESGLEAPEIKSAFSMRCPYVALPRREFVATFQSECSMQRFYNRLIKTCPINLAAVFLNGVH